MSEVYCSHTNSTSIRQKWRTREVAVAACGLALLCIIYAQGTRGGFIFDDFPNLVDDPSWRMQGLTWSEFSKVLTSGFSGFAGRPLAMLSFGLNYLFSGMDASSIKATNIALHLFNASLVYALANRILQAQPRAHADLAGRLSAMIVAFLWAAHPLQASTVLYSVQRMEIGAATGVLLSLIFYCSARANQIRYATAWPNYLASAGAILLGLGFKETAILAPAYMLLLELTVFRFRGPLVVRRLLQTGVLCAVLLGTIVFFTMIFPSFASSSAYATRDFTWQERVATQGPVLKMYLDQIVLPSPEKLLFYYDDFPVLSPDLTNPGFLRPWAILSLMLAGAIFFWSRAPLVSLGIGWFFVAHAITSNIVPLELAFEHRNYLALLGPLLALSYVIARATRNLNLDARLAIAACFVALISTLLWLQVRTWDSNLGLATALASRNPDSPRASYALGSILLSQSANDPSSVSWSLAEKEFENAARSPRSSALPEQALIIMNSRGGKDSPQSVWGSLERKFQSRSITPENEGALWHLLDCSIDEACQIDDQRLLSIFGAALSKNPRSARVHSMYATFAFNVMKDRALGIEVMREAIALAPEDPQFKINLARFLACEGGREQEVSRLIHQVQLKNPTGYYDAELSLIPADRDFCAGESR